MPDMNPDQTVIPDGPYADMNPMPTAARSEGPYARMAGEVAKRGRYGDTMLMHVNPLEVEALSRAYPGMVTKNPDTGYPEAFWFLPLIAQALAAVGPAVAAGATALTGSAALGGGLGAVVGAVPGLLGSAVGGLSGALTAAGLPGMAAATSGTTGLLGSLGASTGASSALASGAANIAGSSLGGLSTGAAKIGTGLGKVLAAPVDAIAGALGTGEVAAGEIAAGEIAAADAALVDAGLVEGGVAEAGLSDAALIESGVLHPPPLGDGGGLAGAGESLAASDALAAEAALADAGLTSTAPASEGFFSSLTTGEKLAAGLLGTQAIDAIIAATAKEEKEDWKSATSSYAGPSSWSGRTYTGGSGGGGTGEQSYYSSGRVG